MNNTLYNGAISANLPIFTAGLIHSDVRNAWSLYRQAVLTELQLHRKIESDVNQAYENLQLARRELNELRVEVNAAKQALFLADQQFLNGRGNLAGSPGCPRHFAVVAIATDYGTIHHQDGVPESAAA